MKTFEAWEISFSRQCKVISLTMSVQNVRALLLYKGWIMCTSKATFGQESVNTLDRHLDWHSIDIPIWSTIDQHLTDILIVKPERHSWSKIGDVSTNSYASVEN